MSPTRTPTDTTLSVEPTDGTSYLPKTPLPRRHCIGTFTFISKRIGIFTSSFHYYFCLISYFLINTCLLYSRKRCYHTEALLFFFFLLSPTYLFICLRRTEVPSVLPYFAHTPKWPIGTRIRLHIYLFTKTCVYILGYQFLTKIKKSAHPTTPTLSYT